MECECVTFAERGKTLTAYIGCEIDHHTAKKIREKIDRRMFLVRPNTLVMDFGGGGFMDSSGIAIILGRAEIAKELGATVELCGLSASLSKIVRLAGIERVKNLVLHG